MINYDTVLAVIDSDLESQPALSRALELSEKTDATLIVLMVVYDFSYEMTTMLSGAEREAMRSAVIKERRGWLESEVRQYSDRPVELIVKWESRAFEAIIRTAVECSADIVVKASRKADDLVSVIFTPTDWHLLRKCPMPVLMVKEHAWPPQGNIIAAVNVGTEDAEHAQLNDKLTDIAKDYANLLTGAVHLVNAYPHAPVSIALEIPEFDTNAYHKAVKHHHQHEMELHRKKYGIDASHCHVEEGLPEHVVAKMSHQLDAELVIIGTVGRIGISAAFIGNTAEQVIDTLHCDVLAIKPDGFETPVT
ncbi:universal stress protein UspE [Salinimonas sediminis]|uniref:Universal stress protein UspE n=1 Tax=Salinimonas sediminis TaxID=2303538 RepID=A0A346NM80_9ALTE|nr:universal stress protein UspE [Salinimonas sediminis]AXR06637.1 universal stress protein UspE [Salinimonas sediminis]